MSKHVKLAIVITLLLGVVLFVAMLLLASSGDSTDNVAADDDSGGFNFVLFIPIWIAATTPIWLATMRRRQDDAGPDTGDRPNIE